MKALNLENQKFGHLLAKQSFSKNGKRYYECICDCGKKVNRTVSQLRYSGNGQSCGCFSYETYEKRFNLVGLNFGDLLVLKRLGTHSKTKSVLYVCKCVCGREIEITSKYLNRKKQLNCGCKIIHGRKLPGNRGIVNRLIHTYKSNALKRNLKFCLTEEECDLLFFDNCFYCNKSPTNILKYRGNELVYNGIDRLDSSVGYLNINCVSCCTMCNYKKRDTNYIDFLNWINLLHNNLN